MRRIDLLCKLLGPLFIALIDGISTDTAIIVNFAMNLLSIPVEYFAIARVYHVVPELQQSKKKAPPVTSNAESSQEPPIHPNSESRFMHNWRHVLAVAKKSATDFNLYFQHRAFLPSIAGALLYLTVLNFAGQMVTYLLSAGHNTTEVGIARTLSVVFEVLATWMAPWLMGKIGPVRAGLWLSSWQVTMLVAGVTVFWAFVDKPVVSASALVGGTILSRVGLRGFDLCVQVIVQQVSLCLLETRWNLGKDNIDRLVRMWKPKYAGLSPRSRPPGRTFSSFLHMPRRSFSLVPSSSSGLC